MGKSKYSVYKGLCICAWSRCQFIILSLVHNMVLGPTLHSKHLGDTGKELISTLVSWAWCFQCLTNQVGKFSGVKVAFEQKQLKFFLKHSWCSWCSQHHVLIILCTRLYCSKTPMKWCLLLVLYSLLYIVCYETETTTSESLLWSKYESYLHVTQST